MTHVRITVAGLEINGAKRAGQTSVGFLVPIRLGRGENNRESRGQRIGRIRKERDAVALCWPKHPVPLPCTVTLTRIAPNRAKALDRTNLHGSLKAVEDEVARLIGVDDADPRVTWAEPHQQVGDWGVWVQIVSEMGGQVLPPLPRTKATRRPRKKGPVNAKFHQPGSLELLAKPAFIPPRSK